MTLIYISTGTLEFLMANKICDYDFHITSQYYTNVLVTQGMHKMYHKNRHIIENCNNIKKANFSEC